MTVEFNSKKFSILLVTPSFIGKGGVANYYRIILPLLKEKYNIIHLMIGSYTHRKFNWIIDQLLFIKMLVLYKNKLDLIHLNPSLDFKSFIRDGFFILWSKFILHTPILIFWHGWKPSFEKIIEKYLKWFFNITYKKADCFLVLAKDFKLKLIKWGIDKPIFVTTTVVDDSFLKNFDINKKIKNLQKVKEIKLLFLARVIREKGIYELIEALRKLSEENINNWKLIIAGDGSALIDVKKLVMNDSRLKKKIIFTGYVTGEKKAQILQSSHIYCFPSYYGEGMPLSLLEAMAYGLAIITTPVGGIKDFFKDKRMGFLVNCPISISEFKDKIKILLFKKELLIKYIRFNYRFAKREFSPRKVVEEIVKIYSQLIYIK